MGDLKKFRLQSMRHLAAPPHDQTAPPDLDRSEEVPGIDYRNGRPPAQGPKPVSSDCASEPDFVGGSRDECPQAGGCWWPGPVLS
eukprot:7849816-Pyramimonas_sp.AAC.2